MCTEHKYCSLIFIMEEITKCIQCDQCKFVLNSTTHVYCLLGAFDKIISGLFPKKDISVPINCPKN
jgi:hypothetical protein